MITMSCRIAGGDFDSAGLATRKLKEHLARIGVAAPVMRRAMIASYEAEMNVVIHARTGTLWARLDSGRLDMEITDEGPGIPDVELALREGWSTASARAREMGFGAGMGLPNIRRNSDLFEIDTRVGRGTRIRSTILLNGTPAEAAPSAPALTPSVDGGRCRGCLRCVFSCPVAAVRVHGGRPRVIGELCIGCTACAAECTSHVFGLPSAAGSPSPDGASPPVPAPSGAVLVAPAGFLAGFPMEDGSVRAREALRRLGFAEVRLLEEWTDVLRGEALARSASRGVSLPVVPAFCPGVAALIESRFPSLIPLLGPWATPAEAASAEFPLRPVFLVAACPGQHGSVSGSSLTGRFTVLSPADLAGAMAPLLSAPPPRGAPREGTVPPRPQDGRPADPRDTAGTLSAMRVTGIRHVMAALGALEAGGLPGVRVLELWLCDEGCCGSPLLADDPYLARRRWQRSGAAAGAGAARAEVSACRRARPFAQRAGVRLDPDMAVAIEKLSRMDALARALPGRDCGACGAPSCAAFAEDVVAGRAETGACPHKEEP
jgi:serine/threonine-protein kinase RsbT